MLNRRVVLAGLAGALAALAAPALLAQPYNSSRGLALQGYDVVAYFTDGRPVRGTTRFTHQWQGAEWRFASAEHRDAFAASPERYAPQYGGYCAYGVAQGYRVDVDPTAWRIVDGRLYLNYDHTVQRTWNQNIPGYVRQADENWPRVRTSN